jgi:hypothetical protein
MKAFSIKQPWSWLVIHGFKDVENRSWKTDYRGPVLIDASKSHDGEPDDWGWPEIPKPDRFDYGGIVGQAEIVACVSASDSPWFSGPFGFVIRNATPLPFRACRGMLGFFVPDFRPPAPSLERPANIRPPPRQSSLF